MQSAKVNIGHQYLNGKMRRGWYACRIVSRYNHAHLGERIDVVLRDGTAVPCCDPQCIRDAR